MTRRSLRLQRDERGASLILAIIFIVVAGAIGSSLLTSLASGQYDRNTLDLARNREYAADGAIEASIGQTRANMTNGLTPYCAPLSQTLDNVPITVDCTYTQSQTFGGRVQRNATYKAHCTSVQGQVCLNTDPIIQAQVNFQSVSLPTATTIVVTNTFVQSWNVAL